MSVGRGQNKPHIWNRRSQVRGVVTVPKPVRAEQVRRPERRSVSLTLIEKNRPSEIDETDSD